MNIVRESEYEQDKKEFFIKHHNDFNVSITGNSAEYYKKLTLFQMEQFGMK